MTPCPKCGNPIIDTGGPLWIDGRWQDVCQDCFEDETGREWWDMIQAIGIAERIDR